MPYRSEWVAPEIFMFHAGVTVYYTYIEDDVERPHFFIYSTQHFEGEDGETYSRDPRRLIDVRALPNPDLLPILGFDDRQNHHQLIAQSIDLFVNFRNEPP